MFSVMANAATIATQAMAYAGLKFFYPAFYSAADYYLWAIRWGFVVFVIFAFQGFAMGANLPHTAGAPDGGRAFLFSTGA